MNDVIAAAHDGIPARAHIEAQIILRHPSSDAYAACSSILCCPGSVHAAVTFCLLRVRPPFPPGPQGHHQATRIPLGSSGRQALVHRRRRFRRGRHGSGGPSPPHTGLQAARQVSLSHTLQAAFSPHTLSPHSLSSHSLHTLLQQAHVVVGEPLPLQVGARAGGRPVRRRRLTSALPWDDISRSLPARHPSHPPRAPAPHPPCPPSFADYHNPSNMNFGALRVVNDDLVKVRGGGQGRGRVQQGGDSLQDVRCLTCPP